MSKTIDAMIAAAAEAITPQRPRYTAAVPTSTTAAGAMSASSQIASPFAPVGSPIFRARRRRDEIDAVGIPVRVTFRPRPERDEQDDRRDDRCSGRSNHTPAAEVHRRRPNEHDRGRRYEREQPDRELVRPCRVAELLDRLPVLHHVLD